MKTFTRLLTLALVCGVTFAQPWAPFLDSSRAVDWSTSGMVGFTLPTWPSGAGTACSGHSCNCATQPSITVNTPSAATANGNAINAALASCDATHFVVNLPAGSIYTTPITFSSAGPEVIRGLGPQQTHLIPNGQVACGKENAFMCALPPGIISQGSLIGYPSSGNNNETLPPPTGSSGTQQCSWDAGYAKGSTTLTFNSCPGGASYLIGAGKQSLLVVDQQNDDGLADNNGIYLCDSITQPEGTSLCTIETGLNASGRVFPLSPLIDHATQQTIHPTSITGSGTGPYTVTIPPPGILSNNYRSGMNAGAWFGSGSVSGVGTGFVNIGVENLSIDATAVANATIDYYFCYQCWVQNVEITNPGTTAINLVVGYQAVIRSNYICCAQNWGSQSYGIQSQNLSNSLIENNILQELAGSVIGGPGSSGNVFAYNFIIKAHLGTTGPCCSQGAYYSHNSGHHMILWEGNDISTGIWVDNSWGSSHNGTFFRNMLYGSDPLFATTPMPIDIYRGNRGFNIIGNVIGKPGQHTVYEASATSSTTGTNMTANAATIVYMLGYNNAFDTPECTPDTRGCDPFVPATTMRWGNYTVVSQASDNPANSGIRWDLTEGQPTTAGFLNANVITTSCSSTGCDSAHTLPNSLYTPGGARPTWWPAGKSWPLTGPDVTTGNLGVCNGGTYAGYQAIIGNNNCAAGGGTFSGVLWANHATSTPAMDCYYSLGGAQDGGGATGVGSAIPFDATTCYGSASVNPSVAPAAMGPFTRTQVIAAGTPGGTLTASNFPSGTITWSKTTGTLPNGLSAAAGSCQSGTTTGTTCTNTGTLSAAGTFNFTIRATTGTCTIGTNCVDTAFTNVVVNDVPSITTITLPNGVTGVPYSQALSVSNGTPTISCAVTTGALPSGLSLSGCLITGTPNAAVIANFSITPTDSNGVSGSAKALSLSIVQNSNPTVVQSALCSGIILPGTCSVTAPFASVSTVVVGVATYNNAGTAQVLSAVTDDAAGGSDSFSQFPGARSISTLSGSGYWNDFWYATGVKAGGTTVTVTPGTSAFCTLGSTCQGNVMIWELSNVGAPDGSGSVINSHAASPSPISGPGKTTTISPGIVLTLLHTDPGVNATTVGSPWAVDSVADMGWGHDITASIGTVTPSWTTTGSISYSGTTVAFGPGVNSPGGVSVGGGLVNGVISH